MPDPYASSATTDTRVVEPLRAELLDAASLASGLVEPTTEQASVTVAAIAGFLFRAAAGLEPPDDARALAQAAAEALPALSREHAAMLVLNLPPSRAVEQLEPFDVAARRLAIDSGDTLLLACAMLARTRDPGDPIFEHAAAIDELRPLARARAAQLRNAASPVWPSLEAPALGLNPPDSP